MKDKEIRIRIKELELLQRFMQVNETDEPQEYIFHRLAQLRGKLPDDE